MASDKPLRVAVLLDHIESDYHAEIIAGVLRAARDSPARTLIVPGGWLGKARSKPVPRNFIYDLLPAARIDGVVVLGGSLSNYCGVPHFQQWAKRFDPRRCVVIGLDLPDLPHVRTDNGVGVHAVVTHLIEKHNRRRIAYIRGPAESPEAEARRRAYAQALADHGIPVDERLMVDGGLGRENGVAAIGELFDARRFSLATLNAVVGVNDDVALGALEELTRREISVPDAMSVVGFDDAESARIANPPMTTVNQRVELQAYTAMQTLVASLESGRPPSSVVLQPEVVLRASCGCPNTPRDRAPGGITPRLIARSCGLALIERRSAITADLSRAAAGRILGMTNWESRLIGALERNLASADGAYFREEVERTVRRQLVLGHDALPCHDVLTALRIQTLACASVEPDMVPRIEEIFHESRLVLARAAADVMRDRHQIVDLRMRMITRACLSILGSGTLSDVAAALEEHLPPVGIAAFIVSRFVGERSKAKLEVFAHLSSLTGARQTGLVSSTDLGLDAMFEQEKVVIIEPLEFDGQEMGIAAFTWGAHSPVHYEGLRELLSAAVQASRIVSSKRLVP